MYVHSPPLRQFRWLLLASLPTAIARYSSTPVLVHDSIDHARSLLAFGAASICEVTCANIAIESQIPVYFAPDQHDDTYAGQQGELVPACRVEPGNADEVAYVLSAVKGAECGFTLRSGGHSGWPGASNSDGGLTISLRRIDHVEVAEDRKSVKLGSGAQWLEVYNALDEHGLAVVGGRAGTVGVGGLLLGGGISYISRRHGFGLDTVLAFEMVLPDGTITRVDESKPELFRIMKGGGLSNFGIVTSFEVEGVEVPKDGYRLSVSSHGWEQTPAIVDAIHAHLLEEELDDMDATIVPIMTYNTEFGIPLVLILQIHANHTSLTTTPSVFRSIKDIPTLAPEQPQLLTYAETLQLGIDFGPPNGKRADYAVTAFRPSVAAMTEIVDVIKSYFDKIKHVKGLYVNSLPSPVYRSMIRLMSKRGGNSLCVSPDEEPFWLFSIAANWDDPADDEFMSGLMRKTVNSIDEVTKKHDVFHPYKYFNYAASWQAHDVWAGYGDKELKVMKRLQREYDPDQIFAAGGLNGLGFKLNSKEKASKGKDEL